MKKICYTLCLTVCLLLALQVSAFAGEVPVVTATDLLPAPFYTEGEAPIRLFADVTTQWAEDSTCYRDQLELYSAAVHAAAQEEENKLAASLGREPEILTEDRTLLNLYDAMNYSFQADRNGSARMEKECVEFESGWQDCWISAPLVRKVWDVEPYKQRPNGEEDVKVYFGPGENDFKLMKWWEYWISSDITEWYNEQITILPDAAWFAARTFLSDHPEYFWVRADGGLNTFTIEGETEWVSTLRYAFSVQAGLDTAETRIAMEEKMEAVVEDLMEVTADMTDAQKVTYWDNWLANQNAYNTAALEDDNGIDVSCLPWSAASGLLEDLDPVCEGYAKALQVLCGEAEIPCVQLSGKADGENHMWLAIRVEGKWYYTDPTWDDPIYDGEDPDRDYSSRRHLLTTMPGSHALMYDPRLSFPPLSAKSYYEEDVNDRAIVEATWSAGDDTLTGFEAGKGTMMIILYDADGKMLDLGFCEQSTPWGENQWLYMAPEFDADDLARAARIVRINVGNTAAWSPLTALKAIKEPKPL